MKKVIIILVSVILVLFIGAGVGYVVLQKDTQGMGRQAGEASITIEEGSNAGKIAKILQDNGVIKNAFWFKMYIKKTGEGVNLQPGEFTLNKELTYSEIVEILSVRNVRKTVRVTFPEGSTVIQFAKKMQEAGLCTEDEFLDAANNGDFSDLKFWSKLTHDEHCFMKAEGFLFPDTYEFFADDTAYNMVHKLYAQFDAVMTDELYKKMDEKKMSLNEVITLASLIQEEAGDPANMAGVSGVFTNRLKPNSPYPKMGSDVTWYYISDFIRPYYGGEGNVPEGIEDNYYTGDDDPKSRIGLPAGPLSCPGAAAINAALNPEESDYYFFLTDLTGKYYYAVTYDEHLSNIATMKKVNATVEE